MEYIRQLFILSKYSQVLCHRSIILRHPPGKPETVHLRRHRLHRRFKLLYNLRIRQFLSVQVKRLLQRISILIQEKNLKLCIRLFVRHIDGTVRVFLGIYLRHTPLFTVEPKISCVSRFICVYIHSDLMLIQNRIARMGLPAKSIIVDHLVGARYLQCRNMTVEKRVISNGTNRLGQSHSPQFIRQGKGILRYGGNGGIAQIHIHHVRIGKGLRIHFLYTRRFGRRYHHIGSALQTLHDLFLRARIIQFIDYGILTGEIRTPGKIHLAHGRAIRKRSHSYLTYGGRQSHAGQNIASLKGIGIQRLRAAQQFNTGYVFASCKGALFIARLVGLILDPLQAVSLHRFGLVFRKRTDVGVILHLKQSRLDRIHAFRNHNPHSRIDNLPFILRHIAPVGIAAGNRAAANILVYSIPKGLLMLRRDIGILLRVVYAVFQVRKRREIHKLAHFAVRIILNLHIGRPAAVIRNVGALLGLNIVFPVFAHGIFERTRCAGNRTGKFQLHRRRHIGVSSHLSSVGTVCFMGTHFLRLKGIISDGYIGRIKNHVRQIMTASESLVVNGKNIDRYSYLRNITVILEGIGSNIVNGMRTYSGRYGHRLHARLCSAGNQTIRGIHLIGGPPSGLCHSDFVTIQVRNHTAQIIDVAEGKIVVRAHLMKRGILHSFEVEGSAHRRSLQHGLKLLIGINARFLREGNLIISGGYALQGTAALKGGNIHRAGTLIRESHRLQRLAIFKQIPS